MELFQEWLGQCKALVRHPQVWAIIENEWSWVEAWDMDLTPGMAVSCALLDVLTPEVGKSFVIEERV